MERRTFLRCLRTGLAATLVAPTPTTLAPPIAEAAPELARLVFDVDVQGVRNWYWISIEDARALWP